MWDKNINIRYRIQLVYVVMLGFCYHIQAQLQQPLQETKIAFMADVHLLDVYGTLKDIGYKGISDPKNGRYALIRSMDAQLHSTRLYNENYFAFIAALNDAAKRDIKVIGLPGDFSDDGQPINIRGLNKILNQYSEEHGMLFFLTTGNHDPTRPFGNKGGKRDFLGEAGKAQPIMSEAGIYDPNPSTEYPVLISEELRELGYEEIVNGLKQHGFFPKTQDLYWESPFSEYTYEDYSVEKAMKASHLENRKYYQEFGSLPLPDVSYLVEPVDGIWLLALDANVYVSKNGQSPYQGAGIGYNQVLNYKKHLIKWIKKVSSEAKRLGKNLIAFSHYPMIEFNDGASEEIKILFGQKGLQSYRVPEEKVAKVFADAGLKIHFGGHMHLNDIGIRTFSSGNTLTNVQVPSLAAYKPAYKIATVKDKGISKIETVVLDSVQGFDTFFELYRMEYDFLKSLGKDELWNSEILSSKDYKTFTQWHLKELVRLRLIEEWPEKLKELLKRLNGAELYTLLHSKIKFSVEDLHAVLQDGVRNNIWRKARKYSEKKLQRKGLRLRDFETWNGTELIYDFYRIRSADELAFADIGSERMSQYNALLTQNGLGADEPNEYLKELRLFFAIFLKLMSGGPVYEGF
jgi:3',5'-cyclic AMP phosphodiesterase CpdA